MSTVQSRLFMSPPGGPPCERERTSPVCSSGRVAPVREWGLRGLNPCPEGPVKGVGVQESESRSESRTILRPLYLPRHCDGPGGEPTMGGHFAGRGNGHDEAAVRARVPYG